MRRDKGIYLIKTWPLSFKKAPLAKHIQKVKCVFLVRKFQRYGGMGWCPLYKMGIGRVFVQWTGRSVIWLSTKLEGIQKVLGGEWGFASLDAALGFRFYVFQCIYHCITLVYFYYILIYIQIHVYSKDSL